MYNHLLDILIQLRYEILTFSLTVLTGFFAVMNPIANAPAFVGLVDGKSELAKRKIAKQAAITAFIIVTSFVFLGKYLFDIFGITIPAFKITGGILLFWVGFEMLQAKKSKISRQEDLDDENNSVAISPLAIPILAGPGTIVTAMNYITDGSYLHMSIIVVLFGLILYLNYLGFILSEKLINLLGKNLITVVGKIMGLILAIMGTGMVISGIQLGFNFT